MVPYGQLRPVLRAVKPRKVSSRKRDELAVLVRMLDADGRALFATLDIFATDAHADVVGLPGDAALHMLPAKGVLVWVSPLDDQSAGEVDALAADDFMFVIELPPFAALLEIAVDNRHRRQLLLR